MDVGESERTEVRLGIEQPGVGAVASAGDSAVRLVEPIPPICPRHGEPETGRARVTVSTAEAPRGRSRRFGSALEAAYAVQVAAIDWPECARCVSVRTRWQLAAAATCTVLGVVFVALVIALLRGAPMIYGLVLLGVFGLSFLPIYLAVRIVEPRRAALGVAVSEDGSELVISNAHPAFARAVTARGL